MTPQEIKALITEKGLDTRDRNDQAIALELSKMLPPTVISREVGEGAVSDAIGQPAGSLFIYQLRAYALSPMPEDITPEQLVLKATVEQVWRLLDKVSLDVGLSSVRAGIDQFAAMGLFGLTVDGAIRIKALAEIPTNISVHDVSDALNLGGY